MRQSKMNRQLKIKVNNQAVKILKYKKETLYDDLRGEQAIIIELITKLPNDVLDHKEVLINIKGEPAIKAIWIMHLSQPGQHSYLFRVT